MTLKTLHITNCYHPTSGGIRTTYGALLQSANLQQRQIRFILPAEENRTESIGDHGKIYYLKAPPSPAVDNRYRIILPHSYLFPWSKAIWPILLQEKPDVVEVADKLSLFFLGGLFRKGWHQRMPRPTMIGMSCERLEDSLHAIACPPRIRRLFLRLFLPYVYIPQFDFHLANSDYTAEELRLPRKHRHYRPVKICPPGVDSVTFHPNRRSPRTRESILRKIGATGETQIWIFAGRISPEKNLDLLLETMEELIWEGPRDSMLLLVGDGPQRPRLERAAGRFPPNRIHFWGHTDNKEQLADLLANSDIFLHPNPREPFGIAPLEAMASGTPLVAPWSGGILTYANQDNSWLAPPEKKAFAEAVRSVWADPVRRQAKIQCALQTARSLTWSAATDRMFRSYEQLHFLRLQRGESTCFSGPKSCPMDQEDTWMDSCRHREQGYPFRPGG